MSWYEERDRHVAWLMTHCFALMNYNAKKRQFGPTTIRNPLRREPVFQGIDDLVGRRPR